MGLWSYATEGEGAIFFIFKQDKNSQAISAPPPSGAEGPGGGGEGSNLGCHNQPSLFA